MRTWPVMVTFVWGLLLCTQVSAESVKVYYADLGVALGAVDNITLFIKNLAPISTVLKDINVSLDFFNITSYCDIRGNRSFCTCMPDYVWSNTVCQTNPECCNVDMCVVNASDVTPVCLPSTLVTVTGTITTSMTWDPNLATPTTQLYLNTANQFKDNLTAAYSMFSGFESVTIRGLRKGSVIVDFLLTVGTRFDLSAFENVTSKLEKELNATFLVQTNGMVDIKSPTGTLCYGSQVNLSCSISDKWYGNCTWTISVQNETYIIETGTEVTVSSPCNLNLTKASSIWKGTYTCTFSKGEISHQASITLDVALLPDNIQVTSTPPYPDCTSGGNIDVTVNCAIENSTEIYNITWNTNGIKTETLPNQFNSELHLVTYSYKVTFTCGSQNSAWVSCTFQNRKQQTLPGTITIPIIYPGNSTCSKENDWPKALSGTTAQLSCPPGTTGTRTRKCESGKYGPEISTCVNLNLNNVLNDAMGLLRGRGSATELAFSVFETLSNSTTDSKSINSFANINASVNVITIMNNVTSSRANLNQSVLPGLLSAASNLLNDSLIDSWKHGSGTTSSENISISYLESVESLVKNINLNFTDFRSEYNFPNVELHSCDARNSSNCSYNLFNMSVQLENQTSGIVKTVAFQSLNKIVREPSNFVGTIFNSIVVSTTIQNGSLLGNIKMKFPMLQSRSKNIPMYCVFWNVSLGLWSADGCQWELSDSGNTSVCVCEHLTSFSTLMAKNPITLPYLEQLTYIGLGASISSLFVCLVIELFVWNKVVKSSIAHFRHTALVNISLCLLLADCAFLVSSVKVQTTWCCTLVVVKHFFYLAMFFWMLCLSIMLLQKLIFVFLQMTKKTYLTISIITGYVFPLIIVFISYVSYERGATGVYYSEESCWLIYTGPMKGSIFTFIFPVLTIVIINIFSMVVVISKLLTPQVSEGNKADEKETLRSILKAVVFLTPVFGVTWIFGFFVFITDLTQGFWVYFVNYTFTILNSFQGVFVFLTGCFGDKKVRDIVLTFILGSSQTTKSEVSKTSSIAKK